MDQVLKESPNAALVKRILGEEEYDRMFLPIGEATGLPNAAYWSQEWFEREQELIFRRAWVFGGARAELPEPGHVKPLDIGGVPVVLVHGRDGVIRGFQNVCRHRGMKLVSECARKSTLTCPYHAWAYGLDGKLRARPHFNGPNKPDMFKDGGGEALDLIPVRVEEFFGCLFVNISGKAEPLSTWMAPVLKQLEGYDLSAIRWAGKIDFDVPSNWKLAYENYMENYHVFALHPRLTKFAPMEIRRPGEWIGNTFIGGYRFPELDEGRGLNLPHYPGLSEENKMQGQWFLTMPHFAVEVFPDQFTILVAYPEAPDRCREEIHVFLIGDEAATGEKYAEARKGVMDMWYELNLEDMSVLKGMQEGRRCPAYDGGRLSPHWDVPSFGYSHKVIEMMIRDDL